MLRLSIVIPVFNVEAYVARTLESIYDTLAPVDNFEVIVVNDGTKDGSMEVVWRYSNRTNFTIIEQENQGLSVARMKGVSVAKGDYVWFVDSDDWLVANGVGKMLALLDDKPDAEVLMFPLVRTNVEESTSFWDYKIESDRRTTGREVVSKLGLSVSGVMRFVFRRSFLSSPWLYFPKSLIHEDAYFGPVIISLAEKVDLMKDPVYNYRENRAGSIMTTLSVKSAYDMVTIHQLLMKYMTRVLDRADWTWFEAYCSRRLEFCYSRLPHLFGTPEFKGFIRSHGLYVWRNWVKVSPETSWRTRTKRLLYFMKPERFSQLLG